MISVRVSSGRRATARSEEERGWWLVGRKKTWRPESRPLSGKLREGTVEIGTDVQPGRLSVGDVISLCSGWQDCGAIIERTGRSW